MRGSSHPSEKHGDPHYSRAKIRDRTQDTGVRLLHFTLQPFGIMNINISDLSIININYSHLS